MMKKIEVSTSKLADSPGTMIRKAVSSDTYQLLLALWDELPMILVTHEKLISYIGPDIRFPSQNKTVFEVIITRSITSDLELFKKATSRNERYAKYLTKLAEEATELVNLTVWYHIRGKGDRVWDFIECGVFEFNKVGAVMHIKESNIDRHELDDIKKRFAYVVLSKFITRKELICFGVPPFGQNKNYTFKELFNAN